MESERKRCVDADGGTRFLCQARPLQRDAKNVSATTMTKLQESIKLAHANLRQQLLGIDAAVNLALQNANLGIIYTQSQCRIILRFLKYILKPVFPHFARVLVASKRSKAGATT